MNTNLKTILVPVDFSEVSRNAIKYAGAVAKKINADVLLLHTYHASEIGIDFTGIMTEENVKHVKLSSDRRLNSLTKEIKKMDLHCEFKSIFGPLVEVVSDVVKEKNIQLIVMGTGGANSMFDFLFGTKTSRIIERVNCPVISVPEEYEFSDFKTIVFATDYHDNDVSVIKYLAKFAELFNSGIRIVHVSKNAGISGFEEKLLETFRKEVHEKISYTNITYEIFNGTNVVEELETYILESKADLLVMSTHHRGILDHLLERSRTKKIAMDAAIPLMAFHYKDVPAYFF